MHIHFGLKLDAGCWPEFKSGCEAMIGDVVLGPQGLVGLLETHLGLGGIAKPQALRIRQYMVRMQSLPKADCFYSDSFAFDAWASARELLGWRDELVLHGWHPDMPDQPARLQALAEIERVTDLPLSSGLSDRFRSVLETLQDLPELSIRSVTLQESLSLLPAPWKRLMHCLQACGVEIVEAKQGETMPEEIVLLESDRMWPQAQAVASWLRGASTEASDIALVCQQDTVQLDQALHAQGKPAAGQGIMSAQLGILQLLPLLLENLWKPVRIERLMELLSVPLSPVPAFAARRLIAAIAKAPGLEGNEWRDAIAKIKEAKCEFLIRDGMPKEQASEEGGKFALDLDAWLRTERAGIDDEVPSKIVVRALDRLQKHLAVHTARVPMAAVAMGHCRDLKMILADMRSIGKPLLDRIVDDVIGPGRSSGSLREAAPWGVIGDVSQLCGPVDTLVWWGFIDASAPTARVWTEAEKQWLSEQGIILDDPKFDRARERHQWLTALGRCRRLLLCRPVELSGEAVAMHPLWFEIESDPGLSGRCQHIHAMDLFNRSDAELMGVPLTLSPAAELSPPAQSKAWKHMDAANITRPEKLSPTALGNLFGCTFKWLIEQLGIGASDVMGFPRDSAMIGTLAHQVLEDLFAPGSIPAPNDAEQRADELYRGRVPEMAADLLLPENRAEYEDIRERVVSAARDIAIRFEHAGFSKLECEKWIKTTLDGIPVYGRADVIAYKGENEPHIIDFKYSYGSNYYKKKIQQGEDVQLITYARMLGDQPSPVAYYLIPRREMITIFPAFGTDTVESDTTIVDGWERVRKSYAARMGEIRNGELLAAGLLDERQQKQLSEARRNNGEIHLDPPCKFCDFTSLCGLNEGGQNE